MPWASGELPWSMPAGPRNRANVSARRTGSPGRPTARRSARHGMGDLACCRKRRPGGPLAVRKYRRYPPGDPGGRAARPDLGRPWKSGGGARAWRADPPRCRRPAARHHPGSIARHSYGLRASPTESNWEGPGAVHPVRGNGQADRESLDADELPALAGAGTAGGRPGGGGGRDGRERFQLARSGARFIEALGLRVQAQLAALDGDWEAALNTIENSISILEGPDSQLERGRSIFIRGKIHHSRGDSRAALADWTQALEMFSSLGAVPDARKVDAQIRAVA